VAEAVLGRIDIGRYEVMTIYWGEGVTQEQADGLASWIAGHCPDIEVEIVEGKQPYYHYIISAE
jgi:dihydroxyacetone kinase-like predicted kinase